MNKTVAFGCLIVVASLGAFYHEHPFETWADLLTPGVLFEFLGYVGTTLMAWLTKSPFDALRNRRRGDSGASSRSTIRP